MRSGKVSSRWMRCGLLCVLFSVQSIGTTMADGKVVPPRDYKGSLEERAQEAIIIFHSSDQRGKSVEDLILKINVQGDAKSFAWVIPFPNEPKIGKEDPKLFKEVFDYVESRRYRSAKSDGASGGKPAAEIDQKSTTKVDVLTRQTVGEYDVAVVRENQQGGLNPWLKKEGFQELENADDVLSFYRDKKYVFACIKVNSEALATQREIESHPLRFTFAPGGRDGCYFPMKMTGLQTSRFDVNLYVFYRFWLNDKKNQFGYRHRGFHMRYRDWDSPKCEPDGGKAYSLPEDDPFLRDMSHRIPTITKLFGKLHPGAKYYLTNIQATSLNPDDIREWSDDLWLFPYYTNPKFVPYDVRRDGPASAAWPDVEVQSSSARQSSMAPVARLSVIGVIMITGVFFGAAALAIVTLYVLRRRREVAFNSLDKIEAKPIR